MPSTFTSNTGIELIADGEQTGAWGQTTNDNFDIVDRALNGSVSIALSGTTHTLTTADGVLSDGQFAVLVFTGSPSGTNTVTIAPNTAQKTYLVRNTTAQSVVLTQGSGGNVTVPAGRSAVVSSNGGGASAAVVDLSAGLVPVLANAGVTATAAELNILDGVTATAAELNILDGVTATAAELNILDGVTATAAELNILDGVTATTAELNFVDGVTSAIQTQLDDKPPVAREINSGTGLLGGGNLTANRTLSIDIASQAEAQAGTDNAHVMTPLRTAQAIEELAAGLTQDVQEFTTSGTWTAPANAKLVFVEISGGGGGGGSGSRRDISGFAGGGGGGGGAAGNVNMFRASELTATVFVTIAAGGSGGALVTTNNTFGIDGSAGGDSTFGSLLIGKGSLGGLRGTNAVSSGGGGSGLGGAQTTQPQSALSFSGSSPNTPTSLNAGAAGGRGGRAGSSDSFRSSGGGNVLVGGSGCAGGGGGGGLFSGPDVSNGSIGGARNSTVLTPPLATGVTAGVAGAAGSGFGNGGGGGGPGVSTAAGAGGAGGNSAGGGGGGGSANGFNSGAGGAGGNGFCRVTTYL